jgi:peptide/nickel transport system substrate-binding protein
LGGTLVYALNQEPDTLDSHKANLGVSYVLQGYLGSTLIAKDPETGNYIPYLAERWEVSDDGLVWDFFLRQDVKFHDGTPMTAHDYVWTFQRIMDPETKSPSALGFLSVTNIEAVDDYTLRITMAYPNYPFLEALTSFYMQPLSQAAVEAAGDDYGRQPVGVGPYRFKEWVTGDRIILERNPDFAWGPPFSSEGAPYVETLLFRIIPEATTRVAGLESGDIDVITNVEPRDMERLEASGNFVIDGVLFQGIEPYSPMNVSRPPFDDVRVRQAFNYAVNRDVLIKVVALGYAEPQYGPISPTVHGYWPGVEEIGYTYDLDKAKALMAEAGWEDTNGDGILEKDGKPLKLVLYTDPSTEARVKVAVILQQQYRELGADVEIRQVDIGTRYGYMVSGDYDLSLESWSWGEAQLMFIMFSSSMIGAYNFSFLDDPELENLLNATIGVMDPVQRQEYVNQAQQRIVEQAYLIFLYTPLKFNVWSERLQGVVPSKQAGHHLTIHMGVTI